MVETGDTVQLRVTGRDFISGWDPVEKISLTGSNSVVVYSTNINVKDETSLIAKINTTTLPAGDAELRVINEFNGGNIVSTTSIPLHINVKSATVPDTAGVLDALSSTDSALDSTVAGSLTVSNLASASQSLSVALPVGVTADPTKATSIHIDSYTDTEYKKDGGAAGSAFLLNLGNIGIVYDVKIKDSDNQTITTTDKPVILAFHYDPVVMAQKGISLTTLKVYHWNISTGAWEAVPNSVVSLADNTVSASVSSFNPYSSFGSFVCNDGLDNDGDGLIDYPADPGCLSPTGGDEGRDEAAAAAGVGHAGGGGPPSSGGGGGGSGLLYVSPAANTLSTTSKTLLINELMDKLGISHPASISSTSPVIASTISPAIYPTSQIRITSTLSKGLSSF